MAQAGRLHQRNVVGRAGDGQYAGQRTVRFVGSSAGQWHMPNRNELQSLSDRAQTNLAEYFDYTYLNKDGSVFQAPIFFNYIELQYYWTSTTDASDPTEAWTVFSCDFGIYDIPKTSAGYSLAVR